MHRWILAVTLGAAILSPLHAADFGTVIPELPPGRAVQGIATPAEWQAHTGTDLSPNGGSFGITDWAITTINASSMVPVNDGIWNVTAGDVGARFRISGNSALVANIDLPNGVLLDGFSALYDDTDAVFDLSYILYRNNVTDGTSQLGSFSTVGQPGRGATFVPIDVVETIDNWHSHYTIAVFSLGTTSDLRVRGITLWYRRQIAPAPAFATFADVPTGHPLHQFVEALVDSGITAGCGAGNFCPNDPLTRGQMAVFLAKALGLHFHGLYFGP